jgi:hypothetical protein
LSSVSSTIVGPLLLLIIALIISHVGIRLELPLTKTSETCGEPAHPTKCGILCIRICRQAPARMQAMHGKGAVRTGECLLLRKSRRQVQLTRINLGGSRGLKRFERGVFRC